MSYDLIETEQMPTMWCPGCGNGIVMSAMIRAFEKLHMNEDNTILVSGIGCSSRMPNYMKLPSLHTVHGRALPFATGVKMAAPDKKVIVISGDGDSMAIGGNHFIHACRRNIDMTLIIINNETYGMTKGQYSPMTPQGKKSSTTGYGNIDRTFCIPALANAAGASYIARASVSDARTLENILVHGICNNGFSVIECLSICPTQYGKRNGFHSAVEMMEWLKENCAYTGNEWLDMTEPYSLGEYQNGAYEEYSDSYSRLKKEIRK